MDQEGMAREQEKATGMCEGGAPRKVLGEEGLLGQGPSEARTENWRTCAWRSLGT